jgi:hypothetical protein
VERDLQQLQIDARKQLAQCEAHESGTRNKPTLIETRRQRCRQARYQRYTKVHELHRGGHTNSRSRRRSAARRPSPDG